MTTHDSEDTQRVGPVPSDAPNDADRAPDDADGTPDDADGVALDSDPARGDAAATPPTSGHGYLARRRARRAAKAQRPKRKAPWWELPALVLLAIGIAILVKSFVVQPFYIPSGSMEHTLHGCPGCSGDRILVNKVIYDFRDPEPGDIVVFHAPPGWDDEPGTTPPSNPILRGVRGFGQLIGFVPPDGEVLVKRVIASGGQTVFGNAKGVYICKSDCAISDKSSPPSSYRLLNEPFVFEDGMDAKQDFGPVKVPPGRLWVMGDHRNNSLDSRYHCGADAGQTANDDDCDAVTSTVPIGNVIGKAFVIAWPPSRWTTLGTPATFDAVGNPIVPTAVPVLTLLPLYLARRRRRRR